MNEVTDEQIESFHKNNSKSQKFSKCHQKIKFRFSSWSSRIFYPKCCRELNEIWPRNCLAKKNLPKKIVQKISGHGGQQKRSSCQCQILRGACQRQVLRINNNINRFIYQTLDWLGTRNPHIRDIIHYNR